MPRLRYQSHILLLALLAPLPGVGLGLVLLWMGEFEPRTQWTLTLLVVAVWLGAALALRERREDIPSLASFFLRRQAAQYRKPIGGFDSGAMKALLAYEWPGNIRELEHTVERAVLLAAGDQVEPADLNLHTRAEESQPLEDMALEEVERVLIQKALRRHDGNVTQAAEALGLSRSALYRRLQRYGL